MKLKTRGVRNYLQFYSNRLLVTGIGSKFPWVRPKLGFHELDPIRPKTQRSKLARDPLKLLKLAVKPHSLPVCPTNMVNLG